MELPVLVVGQGLAGSVLAMSLAEQGISCHIADKPGLAISSRVAAGLYNPIVFKRLTFGWRAEEALQKTESFYSKVGRFLGVQILNKYGIYRIHGSADEVTLWTKRRIEGWHNHLGESASSELKAWLNAPFGGAMVHTAGYIHVASFLDAVRDYFRSKDAYYEAFVNPHEIIEADIGIIWNQRQYRAVIFCEGTAVERNPFFETPMLRPAKGEVLVINAPDLPQEIFNGKVYGVPLGNGQFRIGSTYEWDATHAEPTQEKYEELMQQLKHLLNVPIEVIRHEAGIRPSTPTRRPLFVRSKQNACVFAFNGLGTKGVLLAPMLTEEIVLNFKYRKPVHPEFGRNLE